MVAVMYAGLIVEYTDVHAIFDRAAAPLYRGLMAAIPVLGDVQRLAGGHSQARCLT
jgi:ABC-type dipeptide/oligopeptide/nickel transport system ATPase component